eukprot:COSAG01_NODE_1545_length_9958_cov_14.982963_10_plen_73_part_00
MLLCCCAADPRPGLRATDKDWLCLLLKKCSWVVFQTQSGRQSAFKKRSKSALVREKKTVAPLQQTKSLARSI